MRGQNTQRVLVKRHLNFLLYFATSVSFVEIFHALYESTLLHFFEQMEANEECIEEGVGEEEEEGSSVVEEEGEESESEGSEESESDEDQDGNFINN